MPATFAGTLPCGDCAGIDHHLDLFEDGVFFQRERYRGRPGVFDDIGRWSLSSDRELLVLRGGRDAPLRLALLSADELRLLDADGRPIESSLDYSLRREAAFAPVEPRLNLLGLYVNMADAPLFTECLTGRRMPVALEGDNRALEQAYASARPAPGEPIPVLLEGRIAQRMPMEGPGPVDTLVPERFIGVRLEAKCAAPLAPAPLLGSYWKLTRLGDEAVEVHPDQREPHLVLHDADGRLAGSDGCNRLSGRWRLDADRIELGPLAATRMACRAGMAQAGRFARALDAAVRHRVVGRHLELFDDGGVLLARFEAVALF